MPGTVSPHKVDKGQVEDIQFDDIQNTPTTRDGYGITDVLLETESNDRYVRYDTSQSLTSGEQDQAKTNLGISETSGTVTSVGISIADVFSVSGSPITSSGDITFSLLDQSPFEVFQRGSGTGSPSFGPLVPDHIPSLEISKINGLQTALDDIDNNHFVHPTQTGIDTGALGGATVVSRIQVDTLGHTSSVSTRNITPANIGAQPEGNYEVVTNKSDNTSLGSSTTLYPTQNAVKSYTDGKFVDFTSDQVITGTKRFRSGVNEAVTLNSSFEYPDGAGETYNLRLFNEGTENSVMWYLRQNHNDDREDYVMGFEHGVTIVGTNRPSATIITDIDTELDNNQADPNYRYPISLYAVRDTMVEGRGYFGKDNFSNTAFLTANDTLFSEGTIYARAGIRTPDPDNPGTIFDHTTWLLGDATANVQTDSTHTIRVSIDGVLYDIMAVSV